MNPTADRRTRPRPWISGVQPRCLSPVGVFVYSSVFCLSLACPQTVTYERCLFVLEELCLELARAIEAGDTQAASQHASALARQKAVLTIQLSEKNYADGEIR